MDTETTLVYVVSAGCRYEGTRPIGVCKSVDAVMALFAREHCTLDDDDRAQLATMTPEGDGFECCVDREHDVHGQKVVHCEVFQVRP